MKISIFLLLCFFPILAFAGGNYDQYFDKGKELFSAGNFGEAVTYFEKAAQDSPEVIDPYLNIGVCYLKLEQFQKAVDAFSGITTNFPNDWRGYYHLAFSYEREGEIGKAIQNYSRAKELGISGEDIVGNLLIEYQPKEIDIEYQPYFDNSGKKSVIIIIKGNPCVDKELISDTIRQLEKMEYMDKRGIFSDIDVEFVRWEKGKTITKQKWIVKYQKGQKTHWISFNFSPRQIFLTKL